MIQGVNYLTKSISYVTLSSRMGRMLGTLISRYIQLYASSFVAYWFVIILHNFVKKSCIDSGFQFLKICILFTVCIKNSLCTRADMWLILLDQVTYSLLTTKTRRVSFPWDNKQQVAHVVLLNIKSKLYIMTLRYNLSLYKYPDVIFKGSRQNVIIVKRRNHWIGQTRILA